MLWRTSCCGRQIPRRVKGRTTLLPRIGTALDAWSTRTGQKVEHGSRSAEQDQPRVTDLRDNRDGSVETTRERRPQLSRQALALA